MDDEQDDAEGDGETTAEESGAAARASFSRLEMSGVTFPATFGWEYSAGLTSVSANSESWSLFGIGADWYNKDNLEFCGFRNCPNVPNVAHVRVLCIVSTLLLRVSSLKLSKVESRRDSKSLLNSELKRNSGTSSEEPVVIDDGVSMGEGGTNAPIAKSSNEQGCRKARLALRSSLPSDAIGESYGAAEDLMYLSSFESSESVRYVDCASSSSDEGKLHAGV